MRILIVEDNPADYRLLQAMLSELPHASIELFHEKRLAGGVQRLGQGSLDVTLLDLGLPDSQGLETFTSLHAAAPHIPMIVLSGDDNEDWAVEAVRHGAQDYLMKGQVSGPLLMRAMQYAIERKQAEEALRESETRYRTLFESAGNAILILYEGKLVDCNARALEMFACARREFTGRALSEFSPPYQPNGKPSPETLNEKIQAALAGTPQFFEWRHRRPDRTPFDVDVTLTRLDLKEGPCVQVVERDITERKRAEEALHYANQELSMWVEELEKRNQEAIWLNEMGNLLQSCLTEDEVYAVLGQYADRLFPNLPGMLYRFNFRRDLLEEAVAWGKPLAVEPEFPPEACWALRRGRTHMVTASASQLRCQHLGEVETHPYLCVPLSAQGETLGLLHLQEGADEVIKRWEMLASIVAERVAMAIANLKLRETLHTQSIRDLLTGLLTRRFMDESLQRELRRAARLGRPLGLVMLDIDHFSVFNRTFGHEAGDAVLHEMGEFIREKVRNEDIACRFSGEEFVIIFPETSREETLQRASLLQDGIRKLSVYHQGSPLDGVTVSIGAAVFPEDGSGDETLLAAARAALVKAKDTGGDQAIFASASQ
jgi:diguanylate cyclase (GGDEF)-like protein/PAS domain S-box-containing protein